MVEEYRTRADGASSGGDLGKVVYCPEGWLPDAPPAVFYVAPEPPAFSSMEDDCPASPKRLRVVAPDQHAQVEMEDDFQFLSSRRPTTCRLISSRCF